MWLPGGLRRIGMDGKTYPARPRGLRPERTSVERELALTWQALNRADKKACQDGFADTELVSLRRIVVNATETLQRWESILPTTSAAQRM